MQYDFVFEMDKMLTLYECAKWVFLRDKIVLHQEDISDLPLELQRDLFITWSSILGVRLRCVERFYGDPTRKRRLTIDDEKEELSSREDVKARRLELAGSSLFGPGESVERRRACGSGRRDRETARLRVRTQSE